jgi:hypothetical protein
MNQGKQSYYLLVLIIVLLVMSVHVITSNTHIKRLIGDEVSKDIEDKGMISYEDNDFVIKNAQDSHGSNPYFLIENKTGVDLLKVGHDGNVLLDKKVGIGTSTPTQELDVRGEINMSGHNITTIDCIHFDSGGKICSGT